MKRSKKLLIFIIPAFVIICAGCFIIAALSNSNDAPDQAAQVPATHTPAPTFTPTPSAPTNTPRPTFTATPQDTPTPLPSPTDTPSPTPPPEPISLSGSGDSVIDFEKWTGPAIAQISGNQAGNGNFAIYAHTENDRDLIVNTIDPYSGIVPLDFASGQQTTRFEINAPGDWSITILPLSAARVLNVPGQIQGQGDDVIALDGGQPDIAAISGNQTGAGNFAIYAYTPNDRDLIVNTIDPYSGSVPLDSNALVLVIHAVEDWTIDITAR